MESTNTSAAAITLRVLSTVVISLREKPHPEREGYYDPANYGRPTWISGTLNASQQQYDVRSRIFHAMFMNYPDSMENLV